MGYIEITYIKPNRGATTFYSFNLQLNPVVILVYSRSENSWLSVNNKADGFHGEDTTIVSLIAEVVPAESEQVTATELI